MTEPNLVYIDTETTGLSPRLHDTIEVAWAVNDGPIRSLVFPHTLEHAEPAALRINQYHERGLAAFASPAAPWPNLDPLLRDLTGATIVAANYGFDTAFLGRKLGYEPWHHRKIELSSVAMTVFDIDAPEGLAKTATRLRSMGHAIPEPDHTAAADVACLRACYTALRTERGKLYAEGSWA